MGGENLFMITAFEYNKYLMSFQFAVVELRNFWENLFTQITKYIQHLCYVWGGKSDDAYGYEIKWKRAGELIVVKFPSLPIFLITTDSAGIRFFDRKEEEKNYKRWISNISHVFRRINSITLGHVGENGKSMAS